MRRISIILLVIICSLSCVSIFCRDKMKKSTFYTSSGKLYDKRGEEFIIRGINNAHIWFPLIAFEALDKIALTNCNTVRVVWNTHTEPIELRRILQKIRSLKMVAIPELHDFTGTETKSDMELAAKYWSRSDVKDILNEFKENVLINVANEWMSGGDENNWFEAYREAIKIMRKAGLEHCIVIDAAGWGQDLEPTKKLAKTLLETDSLKNLLFDVHMYGAWSDETKMVNELKYFSDNKIPLLVGEFGYNYENGNNNLGCKVNAELLLKTCNDLGIGWIAWSWSGNDVGNRWLDLVKHWESYTPWGEIVVNSKYGIKNTSKKCSIYN